MLSTCVIGLPEELDASLVTIDAAVESLLGCDAETLTGGQQLALLRRLEHAHRRLCAAAVPALVALDQYATAEEVADTVPMAVASALWITPKEARRRLHEARDLTPKYTLSGAPVSARLAHSAIRYRQGRIGGQHLTVIRGFLDRLPHAVDPQIREDAERDLARYACGLRPDQLHKLARHLELLLNPDGTLDDADGASSPPPSCAPPSTPCSPHSPPPACATPPIRARRSTANPRRTVPPAMIAASRNANMTPSWPPAGPPWPLIWALTAGCPSR